MLPLILSSREHLISRLALKAILNSPFASCDAKTRLTKI
jgi:hypothetical protein